MSAKGPKYYLFVPVFLSIFFLLSGCSAKQQLWNQATQAISDNNFIEANDKISQFLSLRNLTWQDRGVAYTTRAYVKIIGLNDLEGASEDIEYAHKYRGHYAEYYFVRALLNVNMALKTAKLSDKEDYLELALGDLGYYREHYPGIPPSGPEVRKMSSDLETKINEELAPVKNKIKLKEEKERNEIKAKEEKEKKEKERPKYKIILMVQDKPKAKGKYIEKKNNFYYRGETIYIYFEPGIRSSGYLTHSVEVQLLDKGGDQILLNFIEQPSDGVYGYASLDIPVKDCPDAGDYTLLVDGGPTLGIKKIPIKILEGESPRLKKERLERKAKERRLRREREAKKLEREQRRREREQEQAASGIVLLVKSWSWHRESDYYVYVTGEVKNISTLKLDSVMAHVTFYDEQGRLITTDSSFLEFQPLMPKQTSPFKIIARYNPLMHRCNLRFKTFGGKQILTASEQ